MTAWAHLPNAKLIDRVLADLRSRPLVWDAARDAARDASRDAARDAARAVARAVARDAARATAWDACMALIAWPEDSALMLDMPVDAVRLLAAHGHHPAVLLLPACIALSDD